MLKLIDDIRSMNRASVICWLRGDTLLTYEDLSTIADIDLAWLNDIAVHHSSIAVYFRNVGNLVRILPALMSSGMDLHIIDHEMLPDQINGLIEQDAIIVTDRRDLKLNSDIIMYPPNPGNSNASQIKKYSGRITIHSTKSSDQLDVDRLSFILSELSKVVRPSPGQYSILYGLEFRDLVIQIIFGLNAGQSMIFNPENIAEAQRVVSERIEKTMDFSVFYFGNYIATEGSDKYSMVMNTAKIADRKKFRAVWTPERHFNEFGGMFPNPSILAAALSMITENIQIRTGSIVSPLHNTVRLAEDWMLIDNLSNGRVAISFASGWQANDFVLAPEHYATRHEYMLGQIATVRKIWCGERVRLTNGVDAPVDISVFPLPVQRELPVWITVSGKEESFIDAGKVGANILTHLLGQDLEELIGKIKAYRRSLSDSGFDPNEFVVSVMVHTCVGLSNDSVKLLVEQPLKNYIKSSVQLIEAMTRSASADSTSIGRYHNHSEKSNPEQLEELLDMAFERFFEHASLLGTKKKCAETIARLKSYGVNEVACLVDFGMSEEAITDSLTQLSALKDEYSVWHPGGHRVCIPCYDYTKDAVEKLKRQLLELQPEIVKVTSNTEAQGCVFFDWEDSAKVRYKPATLANTEVYINTINESF
jgi:natural product biosynthesis luciferase-like monooxygenase protein